MSYSTLRILFTAGWYPNSADTMAGLSIQKHAEALAQVVDIAVLSFHPRPHTTRTEVAVCHRGQLTEIRLYHAPDAAPLLLLRQGQKAVWTHFGRPDLCQVNILDKGLVLAGYLYLRYHIPYIAAEHWSRYLPENGSYAREPWFKKWMFSGLVQKAAALLTVSEALEKGMKNYGLYNQCSLRLHNIVDEAFYLPHPVAQRKRKRILHVSCFAETAKNIRGILHAVRLVAEQRKDFELVMIGDGVDYASSVEYGRSLHFPEGMLHFTGVQSPEQVVTWMYNSDFFLLLSHYETHGIVVSESLAAGLPVLCTRTAGLPEFVSENEGILVPVGDETSQTDAIHYMLDHFQEYDPNTLRAKASQFRVTAVRDELLSLYRHILSSSQR